MHPRVEQGVVPSGDGSALGVGAEVPRVGALPPALGVGRGGVGMVGVQTILLVLLVVVVAVDAAGGDVHRQLVKVVHVVGVGGDLI